MPERPRLIPRRPADAEDDFGPSDDGLTYVNEVPRTYGEAAERMGLDTRRPRRSASDDVVRYDAQFVQMEVGYRVRMPAGLVADDLDLNVCGPSLDSVPMMRQAHALLRTQGDGRFGARSLMGLLREMDRLAEDGQGRLAVGTIGRAPRYDEDTEVKTGGLIAAVAVRPDLDTEIAQVWFCVARHARQQGLSEPLLALGKLLASAFGRVPMGLVHRNNIAGQRAMLRSGWTPRSYDNGLMRYAPAEFDLPIADVA